MRQVRVPLVDMAVDRSRSCGKGSHCARVANASTLLIHVKDRIRCATNAGSSTTLNVYAASMPAWDRAAAEMLSTLLRAS